VIAVGEGDWVRVTQDQLRVVLSTLVPHLLPHIHEDFAKQSESGP
jgi:hypothetical protein